MMNESNIKLVCAFNRLPNTPEKREITKKYLNDDICTLDFLILASGYIDKLEDNK